LIASGINEEDISVKSNFAWPTARRTGAGEYFLALGRLSTEKGFDAIVDAIPSEQRLVIVGNGPERAHLTSIAAPNVEFFDTVEPVEVSRLMQGARALLVPSRCYEGQPRVVLEAFSAGVPVLASRIGGLIELVEIGRSGRFRGVAESGAGAGAG
jgi:glycosyltransferase involved in cell wall biosynthesis